MLIGSKWKDIDEKTRRNLLSHAICIDGVTGNVLNGDGDCIIDLNETLSIRGKCVQDEIIIEDDSEIYSPLG